VLGDAAVEPDELLRLRLGPPTGPATVSATAGTHTLTIRTDDVASGGSTLSCGGLFFSEYIESTSGSNKAVEIFNPSTEAVSLAGYRVQLFANGAAASNPTSTLNLTGTLGSREVYVIINSQSSDQNFLDQGDAVSGVTNFNGDDALTLSYNGTVIDVIGVVGTDPGTSWTVPGGSTADFTLRRNATTAQGSSSWAQASATWQAIEAANPAPPATAYADLGQHSAEECSGLLLPVTLTSFTAQRLDARRVQLQWRTAQELNNAGFVVEASADGNSFAPASALLPAQPGSGAHHYQWTDQHATTAAYYRLRQQDYDGTVTHSAAVFVPAPGSVGLVSVAPNPVTGPVRLHGLPAGAATLRLHSIHGRQLATATPEEAAAAAVWLNQALQTAAPGVYVLTVEAAGRRQHVRLVKP
jgi:Lamin Tail Domain